MSSTNKMQVEAIRQGTVIDHIPAGQGIKLLDRLHLLDSDINITVGFNLPSKARGSKDIIKVTGMKFTEQEANQLALLAKGATINVIDEYKVIDKFHMTVPDSITGAFPCPNSNCITHNEPVSSYFHLKEKKQDLRLKCHYCEKSFSIDIVSEV